MLDQFRLPLLAVILVLTQPFAASAAELIVVEQSGCVYCARFDREIANAYPNTPQGRRAPLRRVSLDAGWPEDLEGIEAETLTPTFILVDDGREVTRLRGYPGDNYFWFLLDEMLAQLDSES